MRHFLGSIGVCASVRGPFFTRHLIIVPSRLTVRKFFSIGSFPLNHGHSPSQENFFVLNKTVMALMSVWALHLKKSSKKNKK